MLTSWLGRSGLRAARRPATRLTLIQLEDRTVPATIGGTVYADLNGNGLFDAGDTPIAASPVELRDDGGSVINSGVTDSAGTYSFTTDNTVSPSLTTLQHTATVPPTATNFTTTVSIPQFDPAFGTLTGIRIDLGADLQGSFQFENLDSSPANVMGTTRVQIDVNRPDNTLLVSAQPSSVTTNNVTNFDGTVDFGGTSGRTLLNLTASAGAGANFPPPTSDLTLFTGTGMIDLPVIGTGTSTASGGTNLVTNFTTSASASITVTYTYFPGNAIRPGNYTVVQTAQPAGFLDGPESRGGVVIAGSVGTDTIPVTVAAITDVLPDNNFGETPIVRAVGIVKLTNGTDNDTAPGVFVPVGSAVTFTYVVTNLGNVPLSGVSVLDDNGTPGNSSDDFNATFTGGDTNTNSLLDLGETWTYSASHVATAGQYTNIATVTGTASGGTASASNPDNHFGATPAIGLVKLTNGTDNNTAPGLVVPVLSAVTFTYVVTNSGNVPLAGVSVADDNGTPSDPADDFNPAFVGGDANADGLLDLTETWTFSASRDARAGQYTNFATAIGTPPPGAGAPVAATDVDNYFGTGPAVRIVALTNGYDNPAAPGWTYTVGSTVGFVYMVTNLGTVSLDGVTVVDDSGTPGDPADDVTAAFVGGDGNANGFLDPAEVWVFSASRVVTAGQHTNVATVNAVQASGDGMAVSASDVENHFGFVPVIAVGAGPGSSPLVRLFNADGSARFTIQAFDPGFLGGVRVAVGDVTGDGVTDIVAGAGPGAGSHVKVFDGVTNAEVRSFFAFPGFSGGVFVGAGDTDGDGQADLIVGAGAGGAPHVKVFSGATGEELHSFFAYAADFTGGVTVAGGDLTEDGHADIVVGSGTGSHVRVFDGVTNAELRSFFAFPGFAGGVFVGAGDIDCDGRAEIVVGAGAGGAPHVKVYDGASNALLRSFFAFAPGSGGGVRVAAGEVNTEGMVDLIVGAGTGSEVKVLDGMTLAEVFDVIAFGPDTQSVFVS